MSLVKVQTANSGILAAEGVSCASRLSSGELVEFRPTPIGEGSALVSPTLG